MLVSVCKNAIKNVFDFFAGDKCICESCDLSKIVVDQLIGLIVDGDHIRR